MAVNSGLEHKSQWCHNVITFLSNLIQEIFLFRLFTVSSRFKILKRKVAKR